MTLPGQGVTVRVTVRGWGVGGGREEDGSGSEAEEMVQPEGEELLLLGQDERDTGAVGAQGGGLLSATAVEHRQRGQRWRHAAVPGHVPQLAAVAVDGVVVVQLDPER